MTIVYRLHFANNHKTSHDKCSHTVIAKNHTITHPLNEHTKIRISLNICNSTYRAQNKVFGSWLAFIRNSDIVTE